MEFLLLLVIILLLTGNEQGAKSILGGIAVGTCLAIAVGLLVLGFAFFPIATKVVLALAGLGIVVLVCRAIYRKYFSPQARLQADHERMNKKWYALSWFVVSIELDKFTGSYADGQREGTELLARALAELETYKLLPPLPDDHRTPAHYLDWINDLDSRLKVALQKLPGAPAQQS